MKLSPIEKETIIIYNEAEKTASVVTHSTNIRKDLQEKGYAPNDTIHDSTGAILSTVHSVPKDRIKILKSKK